MDYVEAGFSYYTGETHIVHVKEVAALEPIHVDMQLLGYDEKRIHVIYEMRHSTSGDLLATGEHVYLHVDSKAGKVVPAPRPILDKLEQIWAHHQKLPKPPQAGRHVGQKRSG
jgi:carnitine 3-dehydrogenase